MFIHLMQAEKMEGLFVSPSTREYFGVKPTAFLSANKFTKNQSTGIPVDLTTDEQLNMFFSISETIKIALSFSKFWCLYAMLLL